MKKQDQRLYFYIIETWMLVPIVTRIGGYVMIQLFYEEDIAEILRHIKRETLRGTIRSPLLKISQDIILMRWQRYFVRDVYNTKLCLLMNLTI